LADKFFTELCDGNPDSDRRKILQWAAMLHETGKMISPSGYHRHSEYILRNLDLAGFSRMDQNAMATIVLGQRGNLKKVEAAFTDPMLTKMIAAIRLAVIFAHARRTVRLPQWKLSMANRTICLVADKAWLARHPLTEYLLTEEEGVWERAGYHFSLEARDFKADN